MKDGAVVVRTLALKRMLESHSGIYIAELVRKTLTKYEIPIDNIVSITTDNGPNMIKAVKVLRLYQSHLIDDFLNANQDTDLYSNAKCIKFIDTQLQNPKLQNSLNERALLQGVHCAAHTVELAINAAIEKSPEERIVIDTARDLVKKLRTPTILSLIEKKSLKKPLIDCITRWCSTFRMVCSIAFQGIFINFLPNYLNFVLILSLILK